MCVQSSMDGYVNLYVYACPGGRGSRVRGRYSRQHPRWTAILHLDTYSVDLDVCRCRYRLRPVSSVLVE